MTVKRLIGSALVVIIVGAQVIKMRAPRLKQSTASMAESSPVAELRADSPVPLRPIVPAQVAHGVESRNPTDTIRGDAAAAIAELAHLQNLAAKTDLWLDDEQWTALAEIVLHAQAVRHAYEATIATSKACADGYRLEIPMYAGAGDSMRSMFHRELRETLGDDVAQEIVAQLGPALEGHLGGFGVSMQTLDFTRDPAGRAAEYSVTRTVVFSSHGGVADKLTTRRETHFPGLEDPSGHAWGPFLSMLSSRVLEKAGS
jgi:hypothetical protein